MPEATRQMPMRSGWCCMAIRVTQARLLTAMTLHRLTITIPGPAMGAVRQTQADRWKQRPAVLAYRAWCDLARACAGVVPPAELVEEIRITSYYVPPESWSKRARAAAIGTKKRTVPDGDNLIKSATDALWKQDAALGDVIVHRRWDWTARLVLEIDYRKQAATPAA